METTFGSKQRFALQVKLADPVGQTPVCHICMWAGEMRIGNYAEVVLLSPIADFLHGTLRYHDRKIGPEFAGFSPEAILDVVNNNDLDPTKEGASARPVHLNRDRCRALRICPNGCEAFDGESAIMVERTGSEHFIWQDFTDKRVREVPLAHGEYNNVVMSFLAWSDPLTNYDSSREHFADKTFVILGKLSRPHAEVAKLIRRLGGRVHQTPELDTSYVLAGELSEKSQLLAEARSLKIPILSETEFDRLLPPKINEPRNS